MRSRGWAPARPRRLRRRRLRGERPDRPARRGLQAHELPTRRADRGREACQGLVHDPAAGRHAAHQVQDRRRAAHRDDLAHIVHKHPPVGGSSRIAETVTFPAPGPYRLVIDVYPASADQQVNSNFQLFGKVDVKGDYKPQPLPPTSTTQEQNGYRFTLHGADDLKAVQAQLVTVDVTGPGGEKPTFTPWFGALAHAIFFRKGSLDYFHTHVCAPGVSGCTSVLGPTKVTGTSATPGKLNVGVLVPAPGTWRLFLQTQIDGKVLTVPFTLRVH